LAISLNDSGTGTCVNMYGNLQNSRESHVQDAVDALKLV